MADYFVNEESLKLIADTIRLKSGTTSALQFPNGFVTEINNINGSGDSSSVLKQKVFQTTVDTSGMIEINSPAGTRIISAVIYNPSGDLTCNLLMSRSLDGECQASYWTSSMGIATSTSCVVFSNNNSATWLVDPSASVYVNETVSGVLLYV